ncbi:UNVERIFIED_CONTAM: hypothetical protein Sangu_0193300 [Sesamum angustifolium]|uniref:Reverse transcriptase/retrotransposon-derived protein RNase H-like domain-containing protein n=1 Tax=Sesamum angustifolium TaxID=2727405 RepID=A0AAW2RLZ8_9LAMI
MFRGDLEAASWKCQRELEARDGDRSLLALPDMSKPFVVKTDVSDIALVILMQAATQLPLRARSLKLSSGAI